MSYCITVYIGDLDSAEPLLRNLFKLLVILSVYDTKPLNLHVIGMQAGLFLTSTSRLTSAFLTSAVSDRQLFNSATYLTPNFHHSYFQGCFFGFQGHSFFLILGGRADFEFDNKQNVYYIYFGGLFCYF